MSRTAPKNATGPKPDERYPLSGLRVLIVDDDAGICQSSKIFSKTSAAASRLPHPGVHAMDWLDRQEFDLVLSDVVMPDMDGYELYQTVKKNMPELPVVLMTAFNYDKDHIIKRSCLEGLQGVIFKKPVNPAMLKKLLLQQCRPEQSQSNASHPSPAAAVRPTTVKSIRRLVNKEDHYNEGMEFFAQDQVGRGRRGLSAGARGRPELRRRAACFGDDLRAPGKT